MQHCKKSRGGLTRKTVHNVNRFQDIYFQFDIFLEVIKSFVRLGLISLHAVREPSRKFDLAGADE